jgi:hypothetical protein
MMMTAAEAALICRRKQSLRTELSLARFFSSTFARAFIISPMAGGFCLCDALNWCFEPMSERRLLHPSAIFWWPLWFEIIKWKCPERPLPQYASSVTSTDLIIEYDGLY